MADIMLNIIHELRKENAALRRELCEVITERDEWREKAVALCHIARHIPQNRATERDWCQLNDV